MATSTKALVMSQALKQRLKLRNPSGFFFGSGSDAQGNPVLVVSTNSALTAVDTASIKISAVGQLFTNLVGLPEEGFSPNYVDLCVANNSATTPGTPVISGTFAQVINFEVDQLGGINRLYLIAQGQTPSSVSVDAQITSSNLAQVLVPVPTDGGLVAS